MLTSLTAPLVVSPSPLPAFLLPSRPCFILKQREQKPEGVNTQEEKFGKKDWLGWEEKSLPFLWLQQSTKCRRHFLSGARWAAPWGQGLWWWMPACPTGLALPNGLRSHSSQKSEQVWWKQSQTWSRLVGKSQVMGSQGGQSVGQDQGSRSMGCMARRRLDYQRAALTTGHRTTESTGKSHG